MIFTVTDWMGATVYIAAFNIVQGSLRLSDLIFLPFYSVVCVVHPPHGYLYSDMYAYDYIPQPCCLCGLWLEL